MALNQAIRDCMERSVLCWLATVSPEGEPNVSPKEIFTAYGANQILIANIASPQSVRNIKSNSTACLSFIDILVQKGYQLKGQATIATKMDKGYADMEGLLTAMTQGLFPFASITVLSIVSSKPIIAPRYLLYPETTEAEQINSAKQSYGF